MNSPPGEGFVAPPAGVSVTDPLGPAWSHMKRMLFPFNAGKWFTLGFVAFLAGLGEGGGGSFNVPDLGSGRGSGGGLDPVVEWIRDNLSLLVTIAIVVVVLGLVLGAAVLWVSSRGKMMLVDCIVNDRAAVEEPWRRWAEPARQLFWVRLWLALAGFGGLLLAVGVGAVLAYPDIQMGRAGSGALMGAVSAVGILLLVAVPLGIVQALIDDFVVPALYLGEPSMGAAWRRMRQEVLHGNVGTIIVFYLMKLALGFGVALFAFAATCLTCCIAALPYLSSVVLLPAIVFIRAYDLKFLEQFGPTWKLFPEEAKSELPWQSGFSPPV